MGQLGDDKRRENLVEFCGWMENVDEGAWGIGDGN